MITFNILGCCPTADALYKLSQKDEYKVLQYIWNNPISMFSSRPKNPIDASALSNYQLSNFHQRTLICDYNKETLNYIFDKKTDYIVIDILNCRLKLLENNGHTVSFTNRFFRSSQDNFKKDLGIENYNLIEPSEVSDDIWKKTMDKLCNELLKHYSHNQIILNEFYGVDHYLSADKRILNDFQSNREGKDWYNPLSKKLNDMIKDNLSGIHIIQFPENVLSIAGHPWGLTPLHYMDTYLEYVNKAIEIIVQKLPCNEEKEKLSELLSLYSTMFTLYKERAELARNYQWVQNALNFVMDFTIDSYENGNFEKWLNYCKINNKKIAVLKSSDKAGKILLKALQKYDISVVFISKKWGAEALTQEEWEECKQADIIVNANIHGGFETEFDGKDITGIVNLLK